MTEQEFNKLTLELLKTYIEINHNITFTRALRHLGIFTDLVYEDPEKTYLKAKANFDRSLMGQCFKNTDERINKIWRAN